MELVKRVLITPTMSFGIFSDGYERLRRAGCEPVKPPYPHPLEEKQFLEGKEPIASVNFHLVKGKRRTGSQA
jgi:hypothetical protein